MGEVTHIPSEHAAIQTILAELDWAYETQMTLIDLIGDIQADADFRVNHANLRRAAGKRLRKSIELRDTALNVLEAEAR